jgi:hypothetical protein
MASTERRRHPRFRRKLLIRIRAIQGPIPPDRTDGVASVENISRGGLSLVAKAGYPPGMVLRLAFPESPLGPAQELFGEVVRPGAGHESGGFALALRFVQAPQREEAAKPEPEPDPPRPARAQAPAPQRAASGGDRRRTTRWSRRILVKYRCVGDGVLRDVDPRVGALENISDGGLVLTVRRELPVGTALEILLPETPLGPSRTAGAIVVWSRESAGKAGQWLAGCAFDR